MSFFGELRRRNVFRMGIAYLLVAWLLLQAVDFALQVIAAPEWILQVFVLAAAVGLPVVLIFSWLFELTPEGIRRESKIDRTQSITPHTGRKLDRLIIAALAGVVGILLADRMLPERATGEGIGERPNPEAQAGLLQESANPIVETANGTPGPGATGPDAPAPAARSVAVLPFAVMSSGVDDGYFADGLTEEILNSLAQLPELLVTARTSSFAFKGQDMPVQDIAAQLGVRHVVEGSVRRSGERLRVTAQLIRAEDGFHVWSENYDSTEQDTIAVQEDIAEKIAVAMDVVLDADKREAMRRAGLRDVEAFIALQKGLERYEAAHGADDQLGTLLEANTWFERVIERTPGYALAYSLHSDFFIHLLMNDATGQLGVEAFAAEKAHAMESMRSDVEAAVRYAASDEERENAELDRAYVLSDWAGMTGRIERLAGQQGCAEITWSDMVSVPYGLADRVLPRYEALLNCDPLSPSSWRRIVRAQVWAGNSSAALEVAQQALQRAPGPWLNNNIVTAMVALGDFDGARDFLASQPDGDGSLAYRMMIAAAQPDEAEIESLLNEWRAHPGNNDYFGLMYHAWLGEREAANRMAAGIDAHPFGTPALSSILVWCTCGAPWDIEATPEFAADLEAAGLAWPPVSPIRFPLKLAGFGEADIAQVD